MLAFGSKLWIWQCIQSLNKITDFSLLLLCTGKNWTWWRSLFSGRGSRVGLLLSHCLFTVTVLSHTQKCSVHRVFFITFYCIAFKVAIWILGWIRSRGCRPSTVQQTHLSAERKVPTTTKKNVLHFMIFMGKLESLWSGSSRCFQGHTAPVQSNS